MKEIWQTVYKRDAKEREGEQDKRKWNEGAGGKKEDSFRARVIGEEVRYKRCKRGRNGGSF